MKDALILLGLVALAFVGVFGGLATIAEKERSRDRIRDLEAHVEFQDMYNRELGESINRLNRRIECLEQAGDCE